MFRNLAASGNPAGGFKSRETEIQELMQEND